jgi:serine/threonine protein kinase
MTVHSKYAKSTTFKALPLAGARRIALHVLRALAFAHAHGVVHCDMEPKDILLVPNARPVSVRVLDIGSACRIGQPHFDCIQSRFYRAPDIILTRRAPSELLPVSPLFPEDSETMQLHLNVQVMRPLPHAIGARAPPCTFFNPDGTPKIAITRWRG